MGGTERRGVKATFSFDKFLSLTTATKKPPETGGFMARLARFELTTLAFGGQYSIQLSYKRKSTVSKLYSFSKKKSRTFIYRLNPSHSRPIERCELNRVSRRCSGRSEDDGCERQRCGAQHK